MGIMMQDDEFNDSCYMCGKNRTGIVGETFNISLKGGCQSEIKADIVAKEMKSVRIWGQVKDCHNCPVPKALLELLRCDYGKFSGVAHTISDCKGFYQFNLCDKFVKGAYKILAGRPTSTSERLLDFPCTSCKSSEPCRKNALCKTCEHYDEESETCRLKNN